MVIQVPGSVQYAMAEDGVSVAFRRFGEGPALVLRPGQTVGAGHFKTYEVPDQVNAMIDQFLHHYVD